MNFGNQVVGTQGPIQKVSLTNTGSLALQIFGLGITGPNAGDFGQRNNCGASLAVGASCTIGVFFPTRVGPRSASISITDNAVGSPQLVPLTGTGIVSGPNATLSPTSLTFATQLVGTTSNIQPVTLTNWDSQILRITGGTISSDFTQADKCPSKLPPLGTCSINVGFRPRQRGVRNGTLSIQDNAPDSPQTVSLEGTGTVVELNPDALDFGTVQVGKSSAPEQTTLTNVGNVGLKITGIQITGPDPEDFFQTNNCGGGVGARSSCTITVTFTPTQSGSRTADVSISDNGGGSPQLLSLSETGEVATCGGRCLNSKCLLGCACRSGFCVRAESTDLMTEFLFEKNPEISVVCGK